MFVKKYDNGTQMNEENCSFTYETSTSRTIKITNTISAISLEGNQYITDLRFDGSTLKIINDNQKNTYLIVDYLYEKED